MTIFGCPDRANAQEETKTQAISTNGRRSFLKLLGATCLKVLLLVRDRRLLFFPFIFSAKTAFAKPAAQC